MTQFFEEESSYVIENYLDLSDIIGSFNMDSSTNLFYSNRIE